MLAALGQIEAQPGEQGPRTFAVAGQAEQVIDVESHELRHGQEKLSEDAE
jgi:hypothetical protein